MDIWMLDTVRSMFNGQGHLSEFWIRVGNIATVAVADATLRKGFLVISYSTKS